MVLLKVVLGIVLIVACIGILLLCIKKTPDNLRGFYGKMFLAISTIGFLGGILLIVTSFI